MKLKQWLKEAVERNVKDITGKIGNWAVSHLGTDIICLDSGDWALKCETWQCDGCSNHFHEDDDSDTVCTARNDRQTWCNPCRDDDAFYCDRTNRYYHGGNYTRVEIAETGATWCFEVNEEHVFYWDSDDRYHCDPPEDHCDDEDEESRDIPDYHCAKRKWEGCDHGPDHIGVELEILAKHDRSEVLSEAIDNGLVGERDGSLDGCRGIEIIGPPINFFDYPKSGWKGFVDYAQRNALGWKAGTGYGMHVNLNAQGMRRIVRNKIVAFVCNNPGLCCMIAGRNESEYTRYKNKRLATAAYDSRHSHDAATLHPSDNRIEIRIFRSTLKWDSFLKNVQFAYSVLLFARECSLQDLKEDRYREWYGRRLEKEKKFAQLTGWMMKGGYKDVSLDC